MAAMYQLSPDRPHITLSPSDDVVGFDHLQKPITTFTALLHAAQSVATNTSATTDACDAKAPKASDTKRRLRNRVSCRKTRLKRKLQHHALEILTRERQERHEYLTKLSQKLEVENKNEGVMFSGGSHQPGYDELFREFAAKSLHYALVDNEYPGWDNEVTPRASTTDMEQYSEVEANLRRSKRLRRVHDTDVSTALWSDSATPQTSLFAQWRPIVDGLQNVDLNLLRMKESDLGGGVYERHCYWKFVGLSSVKIQREGEIAAVAVSGTTRLRFHGRQLQHVGISSVRQDNVIFNFD
ncbi:hypothetical protein PHMEG_00036656 [Phytophthora megakarya]|uniref:BZIP domain-containing protein n=1 Tax=Phytophthora megakarya TaxID=4795 RepID=A0A225UMN8_9STRA|nr:hypothetical protein PHMEG_00036656 [Phytophthora megakarya]